MTEDRNRQKREAMALLRQGLDAAAADLPEGAPQRIDRLTLRLPHGARAGDVGAAVRRAVARGGQSGGSETT